MQPTKQDIETALDELKAALMEYLKASEAEVEIKLKKMKAQKRLTMARDEVRALTIS